MQDEPEQSTKERSTAAALRARASKGFFIRLGWPPPGWRPYSARANQYRAECWQWLTESPLPEFANREPLAITIIACPADGRTAKPFATVIDASLDVLMHCRVVQHLSQVQEVHIKRGAPGRPGYLDIWLKPTKDHVAAGA